MKDKIRLSIILTTHAEEEHFNDLLSGVLSFEGDHFEVIVINDSTDVVTGTFIEREIAKSKNDRVYLFNHTEVRGRGVSLNEAVMHAEGALIWAPLRADRLNESLLVEAVNRFKTDPAAFWVMDYSIPERFLEWFDAAGDGDLPDDSCLIWNRNIIRADQFFFNPYMDELHGAELAFRLIQDNSWQKTDPFFVIADDQSLFGSESDQQEFLYTALRLCRSQDERSGLLERLANPNFNSSKKELDQKNLVEARKYLQQGDANKSLELINQFLKRNPENQEGHRIKIASLEKLRRHVEAAELKHNLYRKKKSEKEISKPVHIDEAVSEPEESESAESQPGKIKLSVIIPTTGHGKQLLENSLIHLEPLVDEKTTELIVIDNASIDDTFDYLEQLIKKAFLNIKVIVNQVNKGFAASVNQGLNMASGETILVMHNDLIPQESCIRHLQNGLDAAPDIALVAPLLDRTIRKIQRADSHNSDIQQIIDVDQADSCCFMIRNNLQVRFDEGYQACYYEMEDFCRQIKESGGKLVIITQARAGHEAGSTTESLAFHLNPMSKWKNRARFLEKWSPPREMKIPEDGNIAERFQKLGAPYNPMDPDHEWVQIVQKFLTNEVRTEIVRNNWSEEELLTIVLTLLIADERELLRTMEDRLKEIKPDGELLTLFILYYYQKNIFSRCRHYIEMSENEEPIFDLFDLKMLVADKEFNKAIPLLNRLLEKYPSSPELFYLAAEVYKSSNDEGEAKSFYAMANQLDPYRFRNEDVAFDLNI